MNDPRALAAKHYGIVDRAARKMARRLPAGYDFDELLSAGAEGLVDAARRFDSSRGTRFEPYAWPRVIGAMQDALRNDDSLSRDTRQLAKRIRAAARAAEIKLIGRPEEEDIASELGVSLEKYRQLQLKLCGSTVVGIDDAGRNLLAQTASSLFPDPFSVAARNEVAEVIAQALDRLPERLRRLMSMFYSEGMMMREIGSAFGVTESRVCQLHTEAILRLREALRERFGEVSA